MKGSIAVNNHSTLVVNLKSGVSTSRKITMVKVSSLSDQPVLVPRSLRGCAKSFLTELLAAMKPEDVWFDNSDPMTDYFHTAYYVDVNIGRWNQQYEVTA